MPIPQFHARILLALRIVQFLCVGVGGGEIGNIIRNQIKIKFKIKTHNCLSFLNLLLHSSNSL